MSYSALSDEIDRVTSSPYPSQLRTLRDITNKCHNADISQWAAAKPCLIDALASCLLEGLQQWTYVLEIITRFSFNLTCRDAFLRQQPTLLHSLVAHAVKPGDGRSKYTKASVALLSMPLPDIVALPAEAQTLFVQLFQAAAKTPTCATIEPIYHFLSGTGGLLLGLLGDDVLQQFENHIIEILRKSSGTSDGYVILYCLCIMKMVCATTTPEFRLDNSSYNTQDFLASTPISSRWKSEQMQEFFTDSKAQRSTHLMVLSVLNAISKSAPKETYPERVKSVVHANEIITAIPADLRSIWCKANLSMLHKLQERLCEELDGTIKTIALRFLGKLCELDSLPRPVMDGLELTFMEVKSVQTVHVMCRNVDDSDLLSCILARAPISVLLENALEYAIRAGSSGHAAGAEAVTQMVYDAQMTIGTQKIAGHQLREVLNDSKFNGKLRTLRELLDDRKGADDEHHGSGWCPKALRRTRSRLAHQISNMLLRASRSAPLEPQIMTELLELHAISARGDIDCFHSRQSNRDLPTIGHLDDSTTTDDHIDWREALKLHFNARANVEQDAVGRLFATACASLEVRCETVEKPLREEQQARRALEQRYGELSRVFEELESRHVDLTVQHRTAQEELHRTARERDACMNENSKLLERISQLEHKVRAAEAGAKRQLEELKETMNSSELGAAARIAQKQAVLEDAQEEAELWENKHKEQAATVSELKSRLQRAEQEIEQRQQDLTARNENVIELEAAINTVNLTLKQAQSKSESLERDLEEFVTKHAEKETRLFDLQRDLHGCQSDRNRAQHQLEEATKRFNVELENKSRDLDLLAARHEQALCGLHAQLAEAQEQLRQTEQSRDDEIAARDQKVADVKKRIERYQRKCEEKDQQIAEANALRSNLMSAMGITGGHAKASLPHRSRESIVPQTQTPRTKGRDAAQEEVDMEDSQQLSQSFVSNMSSPESRGGPTPKRSRPRKSLSFAAPPTTKSRASVGLKTSRTSIAERRSIGGGGRQALTAKSGNHRTSLPPVKTPSKVSFAQEQAGNDETTFEGSELFSGTQGAGLVDLQAAFDEES